MTDFVFTGPGGRKITVTGPAGATREEAREILRGQHPELFADPDVSPGADIAESAAAGALRAPMHVPGFLGDLAATGEAIGGRVGRWATSKIFGERAAEEAEQAFKRRGRTRSVADIVTSPTADAPTTMDIARGVERRTGLPAGYVGQTLPGRLAGGAVETALDPLSLAQGPGGVAARLAAGGAAGAVSELGGAIAGPIGSIIGGGFGSLATASSLDRLAARRAAEGTMPTAAGLRAASPLATGRIKASQLKDVRADEAAAALSEHLDSAVRRAQQGRGNTAANLRAELNRIIDDTSIVRTPEQDAAMRKIASSGHLLEGMSRLAGYRHSPLAVLSLLTGHPAAAAGFMATEALRHIPAAVDRRRAVGATEQLREDVLRTAPSGGGRAPPLPPRLAPEQIPAAVVRGLLPPGDLNGENQR